LEFGEYPHVGLRAAEGTELPAAVDHQSGEQLRESGCGSAAGTERPGIGGQF